MSEDTSPKSFPVQQIRVIDASFGASLAFNPYAELPPTLWYSISLGLAPIDLGQNAPAPDIWGTIVETTMELGAISLPHRRWTDISGVYGPIEDQGESSVYVSDVHNPVDILRVAFSRQGGTTFQIDLDLAIAFEHGGAGFRDTACSLSLHAPFHGLSFSVPRWTEPQSVKFPGSWGIPKEYTCDSVRGLFERFVDTTPYDLTQEGDVFRLVPRDKFA